MINSVFQEPHKQTRVKTISVPKKGETYLNRERNTVPLCLQRNTLFLIMQNILKKNSISR